MPRGNGRGPNGMGPMSGRGRGYCAGYGAPGYANNAVGMGYGFGFGRGYGMGRGAGFAPAGAMAALPADVEKGQLERRAEALEEELKAIRERLAAIGSK